MKINRNEREIKSFKIKKIIFNISNVEVQCISGLQNHCQSVKLGWLILAPNTKLSWMAISIKVFGIKVLFKFKFLPEDAYK